MISPHTPPGTKVVCIDNAFKTIAGPSYGGSLTVGATYIVSGWHELNGKFYVMLVEAPDIAFSRYAFRPASLPDCLTDLLHVEPIDLWAHAMEGSAA